MSNYTVCRIADVENAFAKKGWPGEMKHLTGPLGNEQVAVTYRKMPQHTGGKGGYGHHHKVQEEVVVILKGELQVKLDDKIINLKEGSAIRIAPEIVRSLWNDKPEEVELLIISTKIDDPDNDFELVPDFWPDDKKEQS